MTEKPASRIELLKDKTGIYGITTEGLPETDGRLKHIITRPDRIRDDKDATRIALQMIPLTTFKNATFKKSTEYRIIQDLTTCRAIESAHKRGLERLPPKDYFALKTRCRRIVNTLMYQALASANQGYLRTARRYSLTLRYPIYTACCLYGDRVQQIANTFPLAAVVGYTDSVIARSVVQANGDSDEAAKARIAEIREQVQNGARLTAIAETLKLPKVARYVWPANISFAPWPLLQHHPEWFSYMPRTIHKQRRWLNALDLAATRNWPNDYTGWVARRAFELGDSRQIMLARLWDFADWVSACHDSPKALGFEKLNADFKNLVEKAKALGKQMPLFSSEVPFTMHRGAKFVTQEFTPTMSLPTVQKLSNEWHEAVSMANFSGSDITFPAPWYEGGKVDGYTITPIRSRMDLFHEGRAMHNCSINYADRITNSECCFYSVTKGSKREATLMISFSYLRGKTFLEALRSICNGIPDHKVRSAVNKWLTLNQELYQNGNRLDMPDCKPVSGGTAFF